MFLIILLYALFASLFGLSKHSLNYSDPFFLIGSRMLFAGLLLLLHQFIYNRKMFSIKRAHVPSLLLLGFLSIYLTNIAEIWGLQQMISTKACLIYSLSPFLSALTAYFVLKETLTAKKWLGLCIGFMGLIPIFMAQSPSEMDAGDFGFISLPEIALLLAVFCSVYGWTLLKKMVNEFHYTPLMANGVSMTLGGILALLHSYTVGEPWDPIPVTEIWPFIQLALLMCLISNIICYNLYGYLLKRYSATFISFVGLVTPFFAALFGWFLLGETISWHYYISIVVFSIGLTIFYLEELKQDPLFLKGSVEPATMN